MRIGGSLFLIALGAVLKFAITDSVKGVNLGVVGVILMIVGAVGLIAEGIYQSTRRRTVVQGTPVVHGAPVVEQPVIRDNRY